MIEQNKDVQNKIRENAEAEARRRRNSLNRFLNSYLKFFVIFLVLIFLWGAINFIIQPKFNEVIQSNDTFLKSKKSEFLIQYNELQKYKRIISEFSDINPNDIYRVEKMIPAEYTRDSLFTEITYFLIKNKFKIKSIKVTDIKNATATSTATTRRQPTESTTEQPYSSLVSSLPSNVSYYVVDLSLINIDYPALKYLLISLENNLKLIDIFSVNFDPKTSVADIGFLTYYKK